MTKADWLRSEIEKLVSIHTKWDGKADSLLLEEIHSIITRYKEELLELDKTNGF